MASAVEPVVVETPKKSYDDILREELRAGWSELMRPAAGLFLSGLSAGLDVGFSLLLMAAMLSLAPEGLDPLTRRLAMSVCYAIGFVFVNLGRSELFTEHTTLIMFPVLNHKVPLRALARVWATVYSGNLLGAAAFAMLAAWFGPALGIIRPTALDDISGSLVDHRAPVIFASAVIAGWLMGLLSWLVAATRDTIGQILCVALITATIGFLSLHHCIAGSVEVLSGVFAGQGARLADYGRFLLWATTGNIGGGFIFAMIKHAHAVRAPRRELPTSG